MLSYNSGVSKTTRVTPFYATFGIDPNLPLWTHDFSTGKIKSDQVSDQLHQIRKAQSQAHRLIVQNEQHERALTHTMASGSGDFKLYNRIWVRLFDKHPQNPELDPTFEPAIIVEPVSYTHLTLPTNREV